MTTDHVFFFQVALDTGTLAMLREIQWPDEKLYSFFRSRLDAQIKAFGVQRMARAVTELRSLNQYLHDACVIGETDKRGSKGTKFETWSPDVVTYVVHGHIAECSLAAFSELSLIDFVRKAQQSRWIQRRRL